MKLQITWNWTMRNLGKFVVARVLPVAICCGAWGIVTPNVAAKSLPVADIGNRKQLLFDDLLIASKTGFVTTVNPPSRHPGALLVPDRPWEERRLSEGQTVIEDGGIFKMWYTALDRQNRWYLCYATSKDGIHWEKPTLGIIEHEGSKNNNIVFAGGDKTNFDAQASVFLDTRDSAARRLKMVYSSTPKNKQDFAGLPEVVTYDYSDAVWKRSNRFISAAFSADGIHWTASPRPRIVDWYSDSHDVAFWDDRIQKYVLFVRWNDERWNRAIGRSESADFETFPKPSLILSADELDPHVTGLYNSGAMKYPYAENAYFLFPSAHFHAERGVGGGIDGAEIQLAVSRDGIHFKRPWRSAFVGVGREDAFDASQVYMATGMLRVGDELLLYYTGYQPTHKQMEDPPRRTGGIGMVRVRLDGFVSQNAPPTGGQRVAGGVLTTVPLKLSGNRLEVNMDAGAGGWLKVEILDANGRTLPGFSADTADFMLGNSVRRTITWQGKSDLKSLRDQTVQLRLIGRDVKVYAFQFVP